MDARTPILEGLDIARMTTRMLLSDLSDADLLVRSVPGVNHIAWQLGHLIGSEKEMVESVKPGSMPALPEGFAARHTKETAQRDDPAAFFNKEQYLQLFDEQRAGTKRVLAQLSDAELAAPGPESMRQIAPTVSALFQLIGAHEVMHAGQFTPTRRKLGKPTLF